MLWACIHLPELPLEVLQSAAEAGALVIEENRNNRRCVAYASHQARAGGIKVGSSIATAHSLVAGLQVKQRNPALEQQALEHIATLAYGFSPTISIQPPHQVLLEIESCLRLFKGFESFNGKLCEQLRQTPFHSGISYYPNPAGAMMLSRAYPLPDGNGCTYSQRQLAQCPLDFLDADKDIITRLQSMGISTTGELLALPADALARRFPGHFIHYLKSLQGKASLSLKPFTMPPRFDRRIDFVEELTHTEALLFPVKRLTHYLQHYLIARQLCVRAIVVTLQERFQQQQSLVIQLSQPHYEADHLLNLIQQQFTRLTLTQPVTGVRLQAEWFTETEAENRDLFSRYQTSQKDRYQIIDTLRARLGRERVHGLGVAEDHRPEYAWQMTVPGEGKTVEYPADKRPLWILNKPLPLTTKKDLPLYQKAPLTLARGPERIETGWWDHQPVQRDYFIALHPNGSLLWIFRDFLQQGHWFLHGIFS
ncbi:MAG: DNA polymerase Y family protein [Ketobacteraceae bacterium]|nr:DNA polymerase Y family protein [Ketobacteraceae bacterium]